MRVAPGLALLASVAATGCRSEAQQREEARRESLASCKASFSVRAPGVDPDPFCACLVRKVVEEKSMDELRAIGKDKAADERMAGQAALQCGREVLTGRAPGALAPGEPAQAANQVVEEASDAAE